MNLSSKGTFFHYNYNTNITLQIHKTLGDVCLTVLMATVFTLAFESPIVVLEKILFGGKKPSRANEVVVANSSQNELIAAEETKENETQSNKDATNESSGHSNKALEAC